MKEKPIDKLLRFFLEEVAVHAQRVLRDKGMANKEVNDAILSTPLNSFSLLTKVEFGKKKKKQPRTKTLT